MQPGNLILECDAHFAESNIQKKYWFPLTKRHSCRIIKSNTCVASEVKYPMGAKGEKTKQLICQCAFCLFAEKGFKDVTMKDICERTKLSRGGLYRHYESTSQIFLEIVKVLMASQQNEFEEKLKAKVPAREILCDVLKRYENEMTDSEHSLSIAIYEFFSSPSMAKSNNSIRQQYETSKDMWTALIRYGIQTGEFSSVDPEAVYDLIVFSYQGVRMYSKLMEIDDRIPKGITSQIKTLLLKDPAGC